QIVSSGSGGMTARRLLPAAIGLPSLLGWLWLAGQQAGLYDSLFGLSFFVVCTIVILTALIWWNATSLSRLDLERRRAEAELQQAKEQAEADSRAKGAFLATVHEAFIAI